MANLKAVLKHLLSKPKDYDYMMDLVDSAHNPPKPKEHSISLRKTLELAPNQNKTRQLLETLDWDPELKGECNNHN